MSKSKIIQVLEENIGECYLWGKEAEIIKEKKMTFESIKV